MPSKVRSSPSFQPESTELNRSTFLHDWEKWFVFDWGYAKPFSCGWYAMDFDGRVYRYESGTDVKKANTTLG
jgi:hypothetical protein